MLALLITLLLMGLLWHLVEAYVPMPPPMRTIFRVVCIIGVVLYLARVAGVL